MVERLRNKIYIPFTVSCSFDHIISSKKTVAAVQTSRIAIDIDNMLGNLVIYSLQLRCCDLPNNSYKLLFGVKEKFLQMTNIQRGNTLQFG